LTPLVVHGATLTGLAGAAFALVLFVVRPLLPPPEAAGVAASDPVPDRLGRMVALDPVVVNIAQTEGRRYLKATLHVEVADEERGAKEVEARKPQIQDCLVSTLTAKTLPEITAPDALERLRMELRERLGQLLGPARLRRVFITEFVVQ
jgi:flagellar FliL protein